jgi:hypothetical protein
MQKVRKIVESSDGADALLMLAARDSRSSSPSSVRPMVLLHDDEEETSDSFEVRPIFRGHLSALFFPFCFSRHPTATDSHFTPLLAGDLQISLAKSTDINLLFDLTQSVKPKNLKKRKTPDHDDPEEPHSAGSTSPSRTTKQHSLTSQIMDIVEENKKLKTELADLKLKLTPTNILDSMCITREVQRLVALETQVLRRELDILRSELVTRNLQPAADDKVTRTFSAPASPNRAPDTLSKGDDVTSAMSAPTLTATRPVVPVTMPPMSSLGFLQFNGAAAPSVKPVMQPMALVDAVLRECNKLSASDRQLITEFVLGNKSTFIRELALKKDVTHRCLFFQLGRWDSSKGPVQSITMNEETISVTGEEHCEQILFEANLVTGAWTKIKRRGRLHRPSL